MLAGSLLPTILSPFTGNAGPYSIALAQALVLTVTALIVNGSNPSAGFKRISLYHRNLTPRMVGNRTSTSDWSPIQALMANLDWGPKIFVSRLLNVVGALLLLITLGGRGFTQDDLFLRIGQLNAPVKPERILWFRSHIRWWHLGPLIIVIFAMAMTAFLFTSLRPNFWQLSQHWASFPWALATAALECRQRRIPVPLCSSGTPS